MTKKIFKSVSYLLHPIFMTILGVTIILTYSHLAMLPFEGKKAIFIITALTTLLFPLAVIPLFLFQRLLTGYAFTDRKERLLPTFMTALFYYFGYFILHKYAAPVFLQNYLLSAFICVLLAAIIHLKWKISLHMIGIGGFIGLLSVLSHLYQINIDWLLLSSIAAAGIIGSARLYLQEHSQIQVYTGFLLGFIVTFSLMIYIN